MSVVEVAPDRAFYPPILEEYESHLLARVEYEDELCLAGIRAVLHDGAPMLEWAMKTESGIIYPDQGKKVGMLLTAEVASLDLAPSEDLEPDTILSLPRIESVDRLLWNPASMVYGVVQAAQARLGYR
jgi:hypothetical protein